MKCSGKHDTTWHILRSITFSPQHFMLYRGKTITFGTVCHLCQRTGQEHLTCSSHGSSLDAVEGFTSLHCNLKEVKDCVTRFDSALSRTAPGSTQRRPGEPSDWLKALIEGPGCVHMKFLGELFDEIYFEISPVPASHKIFSILASVDCKFGKNFTNICFWIKSDLLGWQSIT